MLANCFTEWIKSTSYRSWRWVKARSYRVTMGAGSITTGLVQNFWHSTPTPPTHNWGFFLLLANIIRSVFQLWLERLDGPSILKFKELLFFRNSIFNHIRFFSGGPSRQIASIVKVTFPSISHIVCNIASAAYQHSPNLTFCADLETFPGCFSTKNCELSLDKISDFPCLRKIWHASWFQQDSPTFYPYQYHPPLRPILEPRFTRGIQPRSLP